MIPAATFDSVACRASPTARPAVARTASKLLVWKPSWPIAANKHTPSNQVAHTRAKDPAQRRLYTEPAIHKAMHHPLADAR